MEPLPRTSISEHFATLTDPRAERGRVFRLLDPDELRRCFVDWVRAVVGEPTPGAEPGSMGQQMVAVAGKTLRRSHARRSGPGSLQLVSAWATASGLVVGQVATEEKSNEITAGNSRPFA